MGRLWSCGFELNSNTDGVEFTSSVNVNIQSSTKRTGDYAFQVTPMLYGGPFLQEEFAPYDMDGQFFVRAYFRFVTFPSVEQSIITFIDEGYIERVWITINSSGVLKLFDEDGQITGTTTLTTGTAWYRIEALFDRTGGAGTHTVQARVNGTQFAGATNRNISTGIWGWEVGGNIMNEVLSEEDEVGLWYIDDLAVNDPNGSYQNSWPGVGAVVLLKPNGAGDYSQWSNDYTYIDEIPPNDSTDYIQTNSSSQITDCEITNTPASIESDNTINVVLVGIRFTLSTASSSTFATRLKASPGGTTDESAIMGGTDTSWHTNNEGTRIEYTPLNNNSNYEQPGTSNPWTKAALDTAQIGVRSVSAATYIRVSTLWLMVDYIPTPVNLKVDLFQVEFTVTQTKTCTAKARIKIAGATKTATSKARIKQAGVTKTETSKARIKQLGVTKTATAKARIKIIGITKTADSKARIKVAAVTKTVTGKARIKILAVTKTATSKARIKILGINKTVSAKGKIVITQTQTKTCTAKARIKLIGVTKNIDAKARIKLLGVTKTVSAKANIVTTQTQTKTVTSKGRIKILGVTKTETSKGRIKIIGITKTVTAKGRIKTAGVTKTASAKGRIKVLGITQTVTAKGMILVTGTQTKTATAKGRIKILGVTKTVTAKGKIVTTTTQTKTATSKGRIKILAVTKTVTAKARIKKAGLTNTATAKGRLLGYTTKEKTVTAKANIYILVGVISLNGTDLPIPSESRIVPLYKWGKPETLGGKDRREVLAQKYRYEIRWGFMKKDSYQTLENIVNSGSPVTLQYERYPQSQTGISVLVDLGERTHVAMVDGADFYSDVTLTAVEVNSRV